MKKPSHVGGYCPGGDSDSWYPELWRYMCQELGVRSVLDVGCGQGYSIKYFKGLGCEVLGIDGSPIACETSVIPEFQVLHDFTSGPFEANTTYDLVWSCEFVEHVEPRYLHNFLAAFRKADRYVAMTHAVPGQKGYHHVNCQPSRYWVRRMREIGFNLDYSLTRRARIKAGRGYFRKSGLIFVKSSEDRLLQSRFSLALLAFEWFPRRALSYIWRWCITR